MEMTGQLESCSDLTSRSDTLVTTLGPARQVCVFAHRKLPDWS
jgi:hypothetical protein